MWNLLSTLQKNLVWSIPISMFLGLIFGYLFNAAFLKQFIIPVTFVMVYPMMVTLNIKSIFKGGDYKLQIATQLINFILIPLACFYIGKLFLSGADEKFGLWAVGLFLIGVLPTSGMTISWTGFAKGNKEAAIKMVIFGLVIGSIAAPIYTKIFMGASIEVNMLHMFKQIALFVFVPLFAGIATQISGVKKYGEKIWNQKFKPRFSPFSALGVTIIAFVAMSLKAKNIIKNPGDIITILIPLTLFYLISYVFLSIVGKVFFKRGDAIAMVFGVVMRDLSIALAIAMTAFGEQGLTIALLISLAYVIQIQSAAWYVKFSDKIFGKAPEEEEEASPPSPVPDKEVMPAEKVTDDPFFVHGAAIVPDIKKILYVTDLSKTARYAVRYACSLGNKYEAEVTMLHVIPDRLEEFSSGAGIDLTERFGKKWDEFNAKSIDMAKKTIRMRIRETSEQITKEIPYCPFTEEKFIVEAGNPVNRIVSVAEEGDYDFVIMGTHGHGKLESAIVGSVAGGVINRCVKPVLVVRLPQEEV
ncbi:universal stress protein [Desulfobacterales bacterium HSG16]|nr:universal stress protein [Desulfobacterales bacterium HSG16]